LKMYLYVRKVYRITKHFPKDELYGVTSQFRRAALSVLLNYVEGYARFKPKTKLYFYEISYASLKESMVLIFFSYKEDYMNEANYKELIEKADEIGKMLWSEIELAKIRC